MGVASPQSRRLIIKGFALHYRLPTKAIHCDYLRLTTYWMSSKPFLPPLALAASCRPNMALRPKMQIVRLSHYVHDFGSSPLAI